MKVVYIASVGVRIPSRTAHSVHMINIASAMVSIGHTVIFLAPEITEKSDDLYEFYGVKRNFEIRFLGVIRSKLFTPIYSLKTMWCVSKIKPDLVVSRSALCCLLSAWLGRSVVFDSHAPTWNSGTYHRFVFSLLRRTKNLKRMTVNSAALKEMYLRHAIQPLCPIVVAHNGSSENNLDEKLIVWPGRKDALQVGYMGHLYPGRGVEEILTSAAKLPEIDFHIVGGTENDINHWKNQVNLRNVYFHGFVKPAEVYLYRNMCDVLLAPYKATGVFSAGGKEDSSQYMNPIKVIEYMSSRKAILASDLPPLREILDDDRAILVNPSSSDGWTEGILRLLDSELRNKIALQSFKYFKSNLTWAARAKKMVEGIV